MKIRIAILSIAVFAALLAPAAVMAKGKPWAFTSLQNDTVSVIWSGCPSIVSDDAMIIKTLDVTQDRIDDMTDALNNGGTAIITMSVEGSSSTLGDGKAWYGARITIKHVMVGGGSITLLDAIEGDFATSGADFFHTTPYEVSLDLTDVGQMSDGDTLVTLVRGTGTVRVGTVDGNGDGDPCESIDQGIVHVNIPSSGRPALSVTGL